MSQIASPISHQSPPLSLRPRVPAEPNSANGSLSSRSYRPKPSRLNISASPLRGLSATHRAENVSPTGLVDNLRNSTGSITGGNRKQKTSCQSAFPRKVYMEIGLENLGNTCFMNSSLQCLLHIQPLVSYFLATDIDKVLNVTSPMKGLLASSFAQLVREIFNASAGSSVAPLHFQKVVGYHAPHLLDNQQQDCQEFLRFLLDGMSEDLCRKRIIRKDEQCCEDSSSSPNILKKRVVISSRTREKIRAGRLMTGQTRQYTGPREESGPETGTNNNSEELKDSEDDLKGSPEKPSDGLSSSEHSAQRDWDDGQKIDEDAEYGNGKSCDEYCSKFTSANRLREEVGLASSNYARADNNGNMRSKNNGIDHADYAGDDRGAELLGRSTSGTKIKDSICNNESAEMFPEWFKSKDTLPTKHHDVTLDNLSFSHSKKHPDDKTYDKSEYTLNVPSRDSEKSGPGTSSQTPNSANSLNSSGNVSRRRFKLPNILGPIGSFALSRGDRAAALGETPSGTPAHTPGNSSHRPSLDSVESDDTRRLISVSAKIDMAAKSRDSLSNVASSSNIQTQRSHDSEKDSVKEHSLHPENTEESQNLAMDESKKAWNSYLDLNNSVVTDIFAGQLQSTIECLTCRNRYFCFDPFLDLSVPIPRKSDSKSKWRRQFSVKEVTRCPLEECIEKFTGEEILDGENMYSCAKCKEKRKCTKKLSIFKYPRVLVIHIKRFQYSEVSREKLSTDVMFPLRGLDLGPFLSTDRPSPTASTASTARTSNASTGCTSNISANRLSPISDPSRVNSALNSPENMEGNSNNDEGPSAENSDRTDNTGDQTAEGTKVSYAMHNDANGLTNDNSSRENSDCSNYSYINIDISNNGATNQSSPNIDPRSNSRSNPRSDGSPSNFEANLFLPIYDLVGVSNHSGTLNGGHYIAHVDTNAGAKSYYEHHKQQNRQGHNSHNGNSGSTGSNGQYDDDGSQEKYDDSEDRLRDHIGEGPGTDDSRWMCFNDERVSSASTANVLGPSAYVLFYRLRES